MPPALRIGDPISCGDAMAQGSPNVFANGIPVSRVGVDQTTGHGPPPCWWPAVPIVVGSPNVFVNGISADRVGDPIQTHCCGPACHSSNASSGSPNVFIN